MSEQELVCAAQAGDRAALDALVRAYEPIVRRICQSFYLVGGEREDLAQWARIGLVRAVRDFSPEAGFPFHSFAKTVVRRVVFTAITAATRAKHEPLNQALSVEQEDPQQSDARWSSWECLGTEYASPLYERREQWVCPESELRAEALLREARRLLSPFEWGILEGLLTGESYAELAERLGVRFKSVDNGCQRLRRKLVPVARELLEVC